jgi:hypothetical protein
METLSTLFGNNTKVKILRLFLFNPETSFLIEEIIMRTSCSKDSVKNELLPLIKIDLLKKKEIVKDIESKKGKISRIKKVKGFGYSLNTKFTYLEPLKNLLTIASLRADESLTKRFTNAGKIKLFIASGVFIQNWDSRVDLLIVGDDLNLSKIEHVIKGIESEIGKEISYSAFETQDFEYRLNIHDRLVRDIIDLPHITLLDRLNIEQEN